MTRWQNDRTRGQLHGDKDASINIIIIHRMVQDNGGSMGRIRRRNKSGSTTKGRHVNGKYLPSDLFKIEFTSWLLALALATPLLPHVGSPGGILVLERGLQVVQSHLLMEYRRYGARQRRHDPNPISGTPIPMEKHKRFQQRQAMYFN